MLHVFHLCRSRLFLLVTLVGLGHYEKMRGEEESTSHGEQEALSLECVLTGVFILILFPVSLCARVHILFLTIASHRRLCRHFRKAQSGMINIVSTYFFVYLVFCGDSLFE